MQKMGILQLLFGIILVIIVFGVGAGLMWLSGKIASDVWEEWSAHNGTQNNTLGSNAEAIFNVNFPIIVRSKWPGPLLFLYPSKSGKNISPVSIAMYWEITNIKPTISSIYSYKCRALLRYDEGGRTQVNQTQDDKTKLGYIPSGKIVEKWRNLYSMGFVGDQMYFVTSGGWSKCKRIDFSNNSIDNLARKIQMKPGETLEGWVFFEMEHDLRTQLPEIIKIELTLTNSAGDVQVFTSEPNKKVDEGITHFISEGHWNVLEGFYDLTKENYSMTPMIDLRRILKEGKAKIVSKNEK